MKSLFTLLLAIFFLVIGALGLLLPVIPGFLFILVAAALLASIFPPVRQALSRNKRMHRLFSRLEGGQDQDFFTRCKLVLWASLEAVNPRPK